MTKMKVARKTCLYCNSKKINRVGLIVADKFQDVTTVDEAHEHKLVEPGPVPYKMSTKQCLKLGLWLSLFFTPFAGPMLAYVVKIMYEGGVDKKATDLANNHWFRQGYCYSCGGIWEN
jgi:hypothetical protein